MFPPMEHTFQGIWSWSTDSFWFYTRFFKLPWHRWLPHHMTTYKIHQDPIYMCFPMKRMQCWNLLNVEHHGVYSLDPSRKGVLPWSSRTAIGILASLRADAADAIVISFWPIYCASVGMHGYPGCILLLAPVSPAKISKNPAGMRKMRKVKSTELYGLGIVRYIKLPLFAFWIFEICSVVHTWQTHFCKRSKTVARVKRPLLSESAGWSVLDHASPHDGSPISRCGPVRDNQSISQKGRVHIGYNLCGSASNKCPTCASSEATQRREGKLFMDSGWNDSQAKQR